LVFLLCYVSVKSSIYIFLLWFWLVGQCRVDFAQKISKKQSFGFTGLWLLGGQSNKADHRDVASSYLVVNIW
jgi:hypothetical protein